MAVFKYKALDREGKIKQGLVEAVSENMAAEALRERGFSIVSIKERSVFKGAKQGFALFNRIKSKDLVIFSRQFAVMISANVAMVQALKIVAEQTDNLKLKAVVLEVSNEVDSGSKLSDALAKRPQVFSNFFISVIRSGETSGKLDEVLNYLADEMEKDYDMTSKIKGAMIYPAFVFCGLGAVGIIMMVFVIPKLTGILQETGAELPFATRILIGTSGFLQNYWWLLIIIIVGLIFGVRFLISTSQGRKYLDILKLKLPVFGKLFQKIYLVRFTRSLNTLIVGGVAISNSLKITSEVVSNTVYQRLIEETIKEVEDGNSISSVFINSKEIPKMVSQMMSIGEKTGKLDLILERLTDFYAKEVTNTVANLMTLMEPLIMVIIGVAVGIMVAAVIMPMYNLAGQF
ncbi:type II secretion system F family protein [Patescibacteria group bacterium]|nr:type II secretion system F family protein [Patescibacteria group bacterium]MBU4347366.1 type II secretion system F family protein [Patescibacteria group bacterium]MBU4455218.1 type II secretion system F family protein [Patescibacteria group bacterium]MCG2690933.1 type II secretion system F family protein [Candidatus Parcubacteria bacterium]